MRNPIDLKLLQIHSSWNFLDTTAAAAGAGAIVADGGISAADGGHFTKGTGAPAALIATDGNRTATLADGAQVGQLKKIHLIVDGTGDAVITPANFQDGTTITMADAGDFAVLAWEAAGWRAIEIGNSVDGVSIPAIA